MSAIRERFESKVAPVPESGCHLWAAARTRKGYGQFIFDGRKQYAHRVAWQLAHGPIPAEMLVLHKCDTPACVNPEHLFLGTNVDNMADKVAKGRQSRLRGEANGCAKLTESKASELLATPGSCTAVAARFGVSNVMVSLIRRGKKWAHLQEKAV